MAKLSVDEETSAALTLFNEYVAASRERTARDKHLKKAERAKVEPAAGTRRLLNNANVVYRRSPWPRVCERQDGNRRAA